MKDSRFAIPLMKDYWQLLLCSCMLTQRGLVVWERLVGCCVLQLYCVCTNEARTQSISILTPSE